MQYREITQEANLFSSFEHDRKVAELKLGINQLTDMIDFELFRPELERLLGYDRRGKGHPGRPPFDPVLMFKVLLIQKFYGLSDQATQIQIADRRSFMQFLGLQPGDAIPDGNTLWDFKEKLGAEGAESLFAVFDAHLGERGVIGREGSIVDASFVEAPRQRNSRQENEQIKQGQVPQDWEDQPHKLCQKDVQARWTKKNNTAYYGYKNHAKVDAKTKLITRSKTTSAEVHDSKTFRALVDASDNAVFADSAYRSQEIENYTLVECDCEDFILYKAKTNRPLSEQEKIINRQRSRIRCRVEHVFARLKNFGADFVRTIGLARATFHNHITNLLYNLDRYRQLCPN